MNTDYSNNPGDGEAPSPQWQMLLRAHRVAATAHAGQADRLGRPYVTHCERVSSRVPGEAARIVGLLHDTLEKGVGFTANALLHEGFSEDVVSNVETLTRRADLADDAFLANIARNPLALAVKVADLEDNIQQAEEAGQNSHRYKSEFQALGRMSGTVVGASNTSPPPARSRNPISRIVRSLLAELGLGPADNQRNGRGRP